MQVAFTKQATKQTSLRHSLFQLCGFVGASGLLWDISKAKKKNSHELKSHFKNLLAFDFRELLTFERRELPENLNKQALRLYGFI